MKRATASERYSVSGTASPVSLRPMIEYARKVGIDVDAVLAQIDLSPSRLSDFDRRIPLEHYAQAWIDAARRSRDPAFGLHAGISARITDFDVLGYALHFSARLEDAFDQITRFHRVLCDGWGITREDTSSGVRFRRFERMPAPDAEAACAVLIGGARAMTSRPIVPHYVSFAHPAPAVTTEHEKFFQCPLRFGAPATEFEFDRAAVRLPIQTAKPDLVAVLDRYMGKDLSKLPSGNSFVEHTRTLISKSLQQGHRPTLETTARALRASARTLQRRLEEHGTSHSDIVDAVQRQLAEQLLAEGQLSITEIAFLTGFEDVSGFRRKYRTWTGHPPSRRRPRG